MNATLLTSITKDLWTNVAALEAAFGRKNEVDIACTVGVDGKFGDIGALCRCVEVSKKVRRPHRP